MKNTKWPKFVLSMCSGLLLSGIISHHQITEAKLSNEELKQDIIRAVQEMEGIMRRSYEDTKQQLAQQCTDGYDYELSLESFEDQGLPFAAYDYKSFVAAYATIQEYCIENNIDTGEGINQIKFVTMTTEEDSIVEYIPEVVPTYVLNENGTYTQSGTLFLTEPGDIKTYEENSDGTFSPSGTEHKDLEERNTKYWSVALSTISIDEVYQQFGLNHEDFKDAEAKRLDKIESILGASQLDQTMFINNSTGATINDRDIIEQALASTDQHARRSLIQIASSIIGRVPYEWGGKSDKAGFDDTWYTFDDSSRQKGLDCSGYAQWILRTANISGWDSLINTSNFLNSDQLYPITKEELQPGDFGLYYPDSNARTNHIGMYLGNGYWIHCSSTANTVTITNRGKFSIFRRLSIFDMPDFDISLPVFDTPENSDGVIDVIPRSEENNIEPTTPDMDIISPIYVDGQASPSVGSSEDDLLLMAAIVTKEAYGEGYNGWVAVAQVIRNRMLSDSFEGTTVHEIVSAPTQFSTYHAAVNMDKSKLDPEVITVCRRVLSGELRYFERDDIIGFRAAKEGEYDVWNKWHKVAILGNHSFYAKEL